MLQSLIDESQQFVTGVCGCKLYKGNCIVLGPQVGTFASTATAHATFEDDQVYRQKDAEGFIRLECPAPAHSED
jgi:argininosuccinate synthase